METNDSDSKRSRKFGLPNWMVNNIERLNFVTDFEQYACSPPETEGFLAEPDSLNLCQPVLSVDPVNKPSIVPENHEFLKSPPNVSESKEFLKKPGTLLKSAIEKSSPGSILESLKLEEVCSSSPDSTPCQTPEPSPAPRRRMSGQQDIAQTSPNKWFYIGNLKKLESNSKEHGLNLNNKGNRKCIEKNEMSPKKKEPPVKQNDAIKLVISNFDINAISPSSW